MKTLAPALNATWCLLLNTKYDTILQFALIIPFSVAEGYRFKSLAVGPQSIADGSVDMLGFMV